VVERFAGHVPFPRLPTCSTLIHLFGATTTMSNLSKIGQKAGLAFCGLTLATCAVGCASARPGASAAQTAVASSATTNAALASSGCGVTNSPPPGGYAWDDLARMAASNSAEAKALLLEADAENSKTAVDTAWRNPQIRMGRGWSEKDEETPQRTGMRTYPDEVDMPSRPFTNYRKWSNSSYDSYTTGLRVYISNPFVNRWLRKRGEASVRALKSQSEEVKYALYCEVKSLCLDAQMLDRDIALLEQMNGLREQLRDIRKEQTAAGVSGLLDLIRAETRLVMLKSELREKKTAHQQLIRRIAVLAGIPVGQVKLRAPKMGEKINAAYSNLAVLTDLAFLRRPDLKRAVLEKEAAEHGVKAARAKDIPWIEYLEGNYTDESGHSDSSEMYYSGSDRTHESETEWQARFAVTIPVFNWLGDEVRMNRAHLAASEARVQGLYDSIRREVAAVWEDYCGAAAERDQVVSDNEKLFKQMSAQINALANEQTVRREDVAAIREELVEYRRASMEAEYDYLRLTQYLESVCGGSLANVP